MLALCCMNIIKIYTKFGIVYIYYKSMITYRYIKISICICVVFWKNVVWPLNVIEKKHVEHANISLFSINQLGGIKRVTLSCVQDR